MRKPILYNGFEVLNGLNTVSRVAFDFSTDVYKLTDGRFLMFFINLSQEEQQNMGNVFEISVGRLKYPVEILDNYSESDMGFVSEKESSFEEVPKEKTFGFAAVAGMDELKQTLQNDIVKPIKEAEKYRKFKVKPLNGILLYGPPGCGKTFIARKLGEELGMSFIDAKHSDFASIYVHGATSKIGDIFRRARQNKPCILFIDELDGIMPKRASLGGESDYRHEEINEFLMQLNDIGKHQVVVIAASNRPEDIDEPVLRTGRIDKIIYVSPPDINALEELFRLYLKDRPVADNVDYWELALEAMGES
jgi:transitional endoplasmic reticulum ATPase